MTNAIRIDKPTNIQRIYHRVKAGLGVCYDFWRMKSLALILTLLATQQIPKNNPNGIWESESGSQYEFRLSGSDLHVRIVPGSSPKFLRYEVEMKNLEEVNTYKGTGFFLAKMGSGKECKFDTQWQLVVVSPDRIIGSATNIIADQNTCEIKEKSELQLDLKRKK